MHASPLITRFLPELTDACHAIQGPILDLACGSGRNGLVLASAGLPVVFADRNVEALAQVQFSLNTLDQHQSQCWQIDFEEPDTSPLAAHRYSAILVFRYLHRPLFDDIKAALKPGGLLIYETFTVAQRQFGRPNNPDFLLQAGELAEVFADWPCLHQYEGVLVDQQGTSQAVAQRVVRRPL